MGDPVVSGSTDLHGKASHMAMQAVLCFESRNLWWVVSSLNFPFTGRCGSPSSLSYLITFPVVLWRHWVGPYPVTCSHRRFLGQRAKSVGLVPAVSSAHHKPAVVELFSAGQISSSLIPGNNNAFVMLEGKEEKQLRMAWEDDCVPLRSGDKRSTMMALRATYGLPSEGVD